MVTKIKFIQCLVQTLMSNLVLRFFFFSFFFLLFSINCALFDWLLDTFTEMTLATCTYYIYVTKNECL